jgi:phage recombination protein Bet
VSTDIAVRSGGALAISAEQTQWTEQQIAVLRSVGVSEDVSPAELSAFLHETQRTGLDPFLKQIYLIGRFDKKAGREVFRSQTGIDGYRVVAHRAAARDRVELEYDDTLWCGPDGVWREMWIWDNPPLAAKVVVRKNGKPFPAIATLNEYAARWPEGNLKDMWKRMPANQLAKCAEALALRKGFPQDLSGIYTDVEMQQSDNGQQANVRVEQVQPDPRTEAVASAGSRSQMQRTHVPAVEVESAGPRMATNQQCQMMAIFFKQKLNADQEEKLRVVSGSVGRTVTTTKQMTYDEAQACLGWLNSLPDFEPPQPPDDEREGRVMDFVAAIDGAPDQAVLSTVGMQITAALQDGRITQEDRSRLLDVWSARNNALRDHAKQIPADAELAAV